MFKSKLYKVSYFQLNIFILAGKLWKFYICLLFAIIRLSNSVSSKPFYSTLEISFFRKISMNIFKCIFLTRFFRYTVHSCNACSLYYLYILHSTLYSTEMLTTWILVVGRACDLFACDTTLWSLNTSFIALYFDTFKSFFSSKSLNIW